MVPHWIGIAMLAFMLIVIVRENWRLLQGRHVRVKGRVVGHRESLDDGSTYHTAEVEYIDLGGNMHRIENSFGSLSPRPAVGVEINVVYPERAPNKGRVPHPYIRSSLYVLILGMMALLFGRVLGWIGD
jgi:hypothetical protein